MKNILINIYFIIILKSIFNTKIIIVNVKKLKKNTIFFSNKHYLFQKLFINSKKITNFFKLYLIDDSIIT